MPTVASTFPSTKIYIDSTEESESHVGDDNVLGRTKAFGEAKTSRRNRPTRSKKLLEKRKLRVLHAKVNAYYKCMKQKNNSTRWFKL